MMPLLALYQAEFGEKNENSVSYVTWNGPYMLYVDDGPVAHPIVAK